jgi:hypothetical protein
MNNKSDKKHKPKPKPKNKKKTASRVGGAPRSSSLFSKNTPPTTELELLLLSNSESRSLPNSKNPLNKNNIIPNAQPANLNNHRSNLSQNVPPPPQPNAQPQGFNTIKSTSRCSIQ